MVEAHQELGLTTRKIAIAHDLFVSHAIHDHLCSFLELIEDSELTWVRVYGLRFRVRVRARVRARANRARGRARGRARARGRCRE